ncbi:aminomethyl-transferring glycine dehydrogenase subunit GcvPB [Salinarimonas sp.]|uniref:aminomethyl-transferring glycine dehydrogenase subunit GcvPB n=1 Tax=Salinarimonas sp. TaxID=2766526 RepID=UPI00391B378F
MTKPREYRQARWNEPVVMELGVPGRRGAVFPAAEPDVAATVGAAESLIPAAMRRRTPPALPEMTEPDVLRHYLHLSQEVLGMMNISLFGTCTMKYNPRLSEQIALRPQMAELHPYQDPRTLQGILEIVHEFDLILRQLSGMDQFVFQAAGGAHAAYTQTCVTRGYFAARGELGQRNQIVTTIQAHPCNPATAAAAGFEVVTLMLEENGYPSIDALKAALSDRTAAVMLNNPDDMGIYNPQIKEWVRLTKEAGALAFYDHANFNGVMSKIRARDLGFDACMFMLHKTFGGPKGGGGPATGAYGCSAELAPFLPKPIVVKDEATGLYDLDYDREASVGKVREFFGNLNIVMRAYAWARAMGEEGIQQASDISVLANNYMEKRLLAIPGVTKSHPHLNEYRLEMTRYSLEKLKEATGIGVAELSARMTDFGVDAPWLAHEPWLVPEPFTPEAGEMWSKEDIDTWIDVVAEIAREAHENPDHVRAAPHNAAIHAIDGAALDDPARWATTWRAYLRKRAQSDDAQAAPARAAGE